MRTLATMVFALAVVKAQTPTQVRFQCTEDDLDSIGQNCSTIQGCPVYLELSGLEVVGPKIFITGNLHTESSTVASILLASSDDGKSWTEPHARISGAGLDLVQFLDFEVGWVAGATLAGRARDPFLLLTTDGGKTWRERPVFDESHPGVIEQFWFESRTSGALVIDRGQAGETGARHEMCESLTGGESWAIQEVSASPIRLKHARTGKSNPDWRLRPDGRLKVYLVERQQSGRWAAVATFPVKVGECKAIERDLAEPPPAADEKAEPDSAPPPPEPAKPKKKRN